MRPAFLEIVIDYNRLTIPQQLSIAIDPVDAYYVLRNTEGAVVAQIAQRSEYPTTYCQRLANGSFLFGYGNKSEENEFLEIILEPSGDLYVERDVFATLPLFYAWQDKRLHISNQYERIARALKKITANKIRVIEALALQHTHTNMTLLKEIHLLQECEVLHCDTQGPRVAQPISRSWLASANASETSVYDFPDFFNNHLSNFIESRFTHTHAFLASGGLDSSVTPLFLHKKYRVTSGILASLQFPGAYGRSQERKLTHISSVTGYERLTSALNSQTDFPLAYMIRPGIFGPCYDREEPYLVPFARLADQLTECGIKLLCAGSGGDDVFENIVKPETHYAYGPEEQFRRKAAVLPPYMTNEFRQEYINAVPPQPPRALPLHSLSFMGVSPSRSNIYIDRGIWPITPFASPRLYTYCQGLPAHFRINKNILRAWCYAHGFPEIIYNPNIKNEDFGPFLINSLLGDSFRQAVHAFASSSIMAHWGYIDLQKLLATLEAAKTDKTAQEWLFYIYKWLQVEINLRYSHI